MTQLNCKLSKKNEGVIIFYHFLISHNIYSKGEYLSKSSGYLNALKLDDAFINNAPPN